MFEELLPIIAGILGLLVSWILASDLKVVSWFSKLNGWAKLGVVLAACAAWGAVQYFGFEADLVASVQQVIYMLLGTQVGYVAKPSGK